MYSTSTIIIPNDKQYIEIVANYVEAVAKILNFTHMEIYQLLYAFDETLGNIIDFSFDEGEKGDITIIIDDIAGGIKITFKDKGMPKDPFRKLVSEVTELDEENLSPLELSEYMVNQLLDKVTHTNMGKAGKETILIKYSQSDRIDNPKFQETVKHQAAPEDKFDKIRNFEDKDAVNISQLFYKSYGYSYVNDAVYFPERIIDLNKKKIMFSVVAATELGKIIGHNALMVPFSGSKIVEWGMSVSDPAFRGQGVMNLSAEFLFDVWLKEGFLGLFAHSVTSHQFTQKAAFKYGFSIMALMVGYAYAELSFKKINQEHNQRESTFIDFKYRNKPNTINIFIPEKHKEMISEIFARQNIEVFSLNENDADTYLENTEKIDVSKTIINDEIISAINITEMKAIQFGENGLEEIKLHLKQHCLNKVDIIYLYLNMNEKRAMSKVEKLEKLGFFFAGMFPYNPFENTLVMQYVNNIKYDYDKVVCFSDISIKLKEYVKHQDPNQI